MVNQNERLKVFKGVGGGESESHKSSGRLDQGPGLEGFSAGQKNKIPCNYIEKKKKIDMYPAQP